MGCGQSTDGHVWAEPTQKVVHINSYNLEHNPYKNKSTFFKKTLSGLEIAAFFQSHGEWKGGNFKQGKFSSYIDCTLVS